MRCDAAHHADLDGHLVGDALEGELGPVSSVTLPSSKRIVPGRTGAAPELDVPLALAHPRLRGLGRDRACRGRRGSRSWPRPGVARLAAIRLASSWRPVIHPASSACRPNSPNDTRLPRDRVSLDLSAEHPSVLDPLGHVSHQRGSSTTASTTAPTATSTAADADRRS